MSATNNEFWTFYSEFVNRELSPLLYNEMDNFCQRYPVTNFGNTKTFVSKRRSAVFVRSNEKTKNAQSSLFSYDSVPGFGTDGVPVLNHIWEYVEDLCKMNFSYALVHIYENGNDTLGYHNDKEALDPPSGILSLSFGATRKFRLRAIKAKSGHDAEYHMIDGSAIFMHPGCQSHYKHSVPAEKTIKGWRINITFRQNSLETNQTPNSSHQSTNQTPNSSNPSSNQMPNSSNPSSNYQSNNYQAPNSSLQNNNYQAPNSNYQSNNYQAPNSSNQNNNYQAPNSSHQSPNYQSNNYQAQNSNYQSNNYQAQNSSHQSTNQTPNSAHQSPNYQSNNYQTANSNYNNIYQAPNLSHQSPNSSQQSSNYSYQNPYNAQ